MKQKLLVAGILAAYAVSAPGWAQTTTAAGTAAAQSSVTIYGDLDEYMGYIKSSNGSSVIGLDDGAFLRSRLGFRGLEDLGGGYKTTFDLEQGLSGVNGSAADSSRLFDRQAWVGMKTPVGEFRFGRQNTTIFFNGAAIDFTERTTMGSVINTFGVPSRFDNDISFLSERMAGFKLELHYAMNNATSATQNKPVIQQALDYQNGPFRVGYMGLEASPSGNAVTVNEKIQYQNLYADYNYGAGSIYTAYVRSNNITSSANGNTAAAILSNVSIVNNFFPGTDINAERFFNIYQISADYHINERFKVGTLYGVIKDTSGGNAGASGGNVGGFYDLSKRTMLYGFVNYLKNEANGGFRFSGSGSIAANLAGSAVNGQSLTGLQFGIVHRF